MHHIVGHGGFSILATCANVPGFTECMEATVTHNNGPVALLKIRHNGLLLRRKRVL